MSSEMPVQSRIDFDAALAADQPLLALRDAVATEIHDHGTPREEVTAALEREMLELRAAGRDAEEDVVTDVLDFVVGWSSPHMRI
jgi:hypothetical protein